MSSKISIAVVGANIGCTLHVRALRGAGFEVAALVGRDPEKTAARARHFGIARALTKFEAALDSDIDAVVVATPPETHHPFVMRAIAAGKHVLCEKPFALDTTQAREMLAAATEAGIVHQIVHPHRWFAHHTALRELVRGGGVGRPIHGLFNFDHYLIAKHADDLPGWWRDQATGGGWLRNYNTHGIDLIRYMIGDFAAVCGTTHADTARGMTADDAYASSFVLRNGMQGVMAGSCRAWDFFPVSRVTGTDGTASLDRNAVSVTDAAGTRPVEISTPIRELLRAGGPCPGGPEEKLPEPGNLYEAVHSSDHGYAEQVGLSRAFLNRIQNPAYVHPAIADFSDGLAHMDVVAAIEQSQRTRRWVDLPEVAVAASTAYENAHS